MPHSHTSDDHRLPDPLFGLSAFERRRLLTMRPTWKERHRMCNPTLSREDRRTLVIQILFERRQAYDRELDARIKAVQLARAHNRYETGEHHLTDHAAYSSTALSVLALRRLEREAQEQHYCAAYLRRRQQQHTEDQPMPLKKRRGLSR